MKTKYLLLFFCIYLFVTTSFSQANIISTNPLAEQIMLGNYNPNDYLPSVQVSLPNDIAQTLNNEINPDSLKSYLEVLSTFENRNTGADTVSSSTGIGAARRWIYSKFEQFSAQSENRLVVSYLQFDLTICSMTQHRNVFAVLPGTDNTNHEVILIEGHFDSRCETSCNITCQAHGMEDNGSGTALVMELARVMAKLGLKNTIVFVATTGEEQGLYGADAFADYMVAKSIPLKAVLNNDVIGGIICGKTSSAPSCPGENDIDSTQVRLFSYGGFNSRNKQLARFIKLEYKEVLRPIVNIPMLVSIMSAEDRTGRGGDHIPFRQKGYAAIRFTSANEHGDASNGASYTDRQHTSDDILGVDTDGDVVIDSFFVDFNYLSRNAAINGNAAAMAAIGPKTPDFNVTSNGFDLIIEITAQTQYDTYRIGIRTNNNNDFDSVYTFTGKLIDTITLYEEIFTVSVASVDENDMESLFSGEKMIQLEPLGIGSLIEEKQGVELLQNHPNPFDEATIISAYIDDPKKYETAGFLITDMTGKLIDYLEFEPKTGINEVVYDHGYNTVGTFVYTLYLNNVPVQSKKMVFAN